MIYIIGVGGVGSWLAGAMVRLVGRDKLTLIDGDTLEEKNLDRQMFSEEHLELNKAAALGSQMGCAFLSSWFSEYELKHTPIDWLMCCVDNNPGRKSVLAACDMYGCKAIFAANETHSSEAYVYLPEWKGTPIDPRIYIPEILSDDSNNPARNATGCTGEAQKTNPQLVTANFMAASLSAHLFVVWAMEARKAKPETIDYLPYRLHQNLTRNGYALSGERQKPTAKE